MAVLLGMTVLILPTIASATVPTSWQRGISYSAWWHGLYSTNDSDRSLELLAITGANWISLIVTCYQDNLASTTISCASDPRTVTDADLVRAIQKAKSLGLKIMLKPHLDLSNDPSHWRGQINFGSDETAWSQWFDSYQTFIVHYAQLAQTNGVNQFSVGTELEGTTHRETDWRGIVSAARAVFSGPLTYAANQGGEEVSLQFWDALDLIGIDAYVSLTNKNNPTVAELKAGWMPHLTVFQALSQQWNKPVIFTELGYRSIDGTNQAPWNWQTNGAVDLQEQADCYQAFFETFVNQPWFQGVFWWYWQTDPNQGGTSDKDYTPHNKPAEIILHAYYTVTSEALFRIGVEGRVFSDGAFYCSSVGCFNAGNGADLAEGIESSESVESGDVLEIDPHHPRHYRKTQNAYSSFVAGVVPSRPGFILANHLGEENTMPESTRARSLVEERAQSPSRFSEMTLSHLLDSGPMALADLGGSVAQLAQNASMMRPLLALLGRVVAKATLEGGPIQPGDLLVSAFTPGHVMRCAKPPVCREAIIGKALEPLKTQSGLIQILIAH
jgi:hypothetical protein